MPLQPATWLSSDLRRPGIPALDLLPLWHPLRDEATPWDWPLDSTTIQNVPNMEVFETMNQHICPGCGGLVNHVEGKTYGCTTCQGVFRETGPPLVCVEAGKHERVADNDRMFRCAVRVGQTTTQQVPLGPGADETIVVP